MKAKKVCAAILITIGGIVRIAVVLVLIAAIAVFVLGYLIFGNFRIDNRWWENADDKTFDAKLYDGEEPMFLNAVMSNDVAEIGANEDLKVELYYGLNSETDPTEFADVDVWGIYVSLIPKDQNDSDQNPYGSRIVIDEDYRDPRPYEWPNLRETFECETALVREVPKEEMNKYFFYLKYRKIEIGKFYRDISVITYNHHETVSIPYSLFAGRNEGNADCDLGVQLVGIKFNADAHRYETTIRSDMIIRLSLEKTENGYDSRILYPETIY